MGNIRLKYVPLEYNGKTYQLTCNFNVLADLQEEFEEIPDLLSSGSIKGTRFMLASMMNDYADSMGWSERITPKEAGRILNVKLIEELQRLFVSALKPSDELIEETEESSKN